MARGRGTPVTAVRRIAGLLEDASRRLRAVSDAPRLEAEVLLARAIDMPRSFLVAHPDDELDDDAVGRLEATLLRRERGEPMAYISGEREFWSMNLLVTPATLIPRPETELLVEQALAFLPRRTERRVLDLGTGSGAVALALARERPLCRVTATDISREALAVARHNANRLALANIEFVRGRWTEPLTGRRFDVIVSNPPYVRDADPALASLSYEPRLALAAGESGLDAIEEIAAGAVSIAAEDAALLLEHGADQRDAVDAVLQAQGWRGLRCVPDYAGHPRVTIASRR